MAIDIINMYTCRRSPCLPCKCSAVQIFPLELLLNRGIYTCTHLYRLFHVHIFRPVKSHPYTHSYDLTLTCTEEVILHMLHVGPAQTMAHPYTRRLPLPSLRCTCSMSCVGTSDLWSHAFSKVWLFAASACMRIII